MLPPTGRQDEYWLHGCIKLPATRNTSTGRKRSIRGWKRRCLIPKRISYGMASTAAATDASIKTGCSPIIREHTSAPESPCGKRRAKRNTLKKLAVTSSLPWRTLYEGRRHLSPLRPRRWRPVCRHLHPLPRGIDRAAGRHGDRTILKKNADSAWAARSPDGIHGPDWSEPPQDNVHLSNHLSGVMLLTLTAKFDAVEE